MKITELLNAPTPVAIASPQHFIRDAPPRRKTQTEKRMDMASLDLFAQKRLRRGDLSMSRIIQELTGSASSRVITSPPAASVRPEPVAAAPEPLAIGDGAEKPTSKSRKPKAKKPKTETQEQIEKDDKQSRRRKARSGFTPLTESEKRVKQRLLVKRSYYRKIDTLTELRGEMEELETECRHAIISRRQAAPVVSSELKTESNADQQRYDELRERYTQLAISQDDLRHENEKLRAAAMEESKARTRIGILLNEELRDQEEASVKGQQLGLSPRPALAVGPTNAIDSVKPSEAEAKRQSVLVFKPLTEDECITIVREAYADIRAFRETQHYETTGASVFGWRDRRQVDGDTLRFFLEKTFPNATAQEISSRMWDLVSSERGVNRIYASDVAITFHRVQCVNAENVLFYRTIEPVGQNLVLKALVLASRIQLDADGSFMVLFRSVDPTARGIVQNPVENSGFSTQKREMWSDVFSWGLYEAVGDRGQHCRNFFGGFVSSLVTTRSLEFWLMHILLIAVRCENEVVGPLFILQ